FEGGAQIAPDAPGGWRTVAPSAVPHGESDAPPAALDAAGMTKAIADFALAAERSARLGIDGIEVHMAHGYLLHQFLSPVANRRDDEYGGPIEGRMRFPLEVFRAVRAAFPAERPVWVRVSASDWVEGGISIEDIIALGHALEAAGCAAMHVSSGGVAAAQKIPVGPGYQVHLAKAARAALDMPIIAVGLITEPEQAEAIIANGEADAIALARALLWNPRWPWHAAAALGAEVRAPKQYWRSAPADVTPPFIGLVHGQR
ncbi:MAG: oxidoreductase, partial [Paracoccaceae bacterium]